MKNTLNGFMRLVQRNRIKMNDLINNILIYKIIYRINKLNNNICIFLIYLNIY